MRHHPLLLLAAPLLLIGGLLHLAALDVHHAARFDLEVNGTHLSLCHTISDLPARCQSLF